MFRQARSRLRLSSGSELSYLTAGDPSAPALLLLHGFPSSARTFRNVVTPLSDAAYVIAPDLPGFGESDVLPDPSFPAFATAVSALLEHLGVGRCYIYLHDFGAPIGLDIAMAEPDRVLGLIIQNANAHPEGQGPGWQDTKAYWTDPKPQNEAAATGHLTFEGTRDQYVAGVPPEIARRIPSDNWEEDWRVMTLPGRMETQRALIRDYGRYTERFEAVADYLAENQPPALLLWGRHDAFFDLAETLAWMKALPRMEAHVFDAGHFLLETHAEEAAGLMINFINRSSTAAIE